MRQNMIAIRKKIDYIWLVVPYFLLLILNKTGVVNNYLLQICMLGGINIIMTVSLNLVNGVTGQFSIGHAGFMAVGAYVSAVITTELYRLRTLGGLEKELIFVLAMLAGGVVSAFFGWLIAQPTLKVKGDYLAIVTIAERIKVLEFGTTIAEGKPEEVQKNPKVIEAYLGGVRQ